MFYTIIGIVISALGFIGGIILGVNLNNGFYCLPVWCGTFLLVIIYFGIGKILKNQSKIRERLHLIENDDRIGMILRNQAKIWKKLNVINVNLEGDDSQDENSGQTAPPTADGSGDDEGVCLAQKVKCSHCGEMTDQVICPKCGRRTLPNGFVVCPTCGSVQSKAWKTCRACGTTISQQ